MAKIDRDAVFNKYGGLCAYTGKPLGPDWQVDHCRPRSNWLWHQKWNTAEVDGRENLLPAIKIINHYKRGLTLEEFRARMSAFHLQLAKLPKRTQRPKTVSRIAYMHEIAALFDITPQKPFSGQFYFEILQSG